MADSYPILLKLAGRKCVVVGGGSVAARKVRGLRQADADVHVVSPTFAEELAARDGITRHRGAYRPDLLADAALVFACTDQPDLNRRIAADARRRSAWCNIADDPQNCDFHVPARLRRGRLQVAVSTDGASPQLAAAVRDRIESQLSPEYDTLCDELARARPIVQEHVPDAVVRKEIFDTLCADRSIKRLEKEGRRAWREWFERLLADRLKKGNTKAEVESA